MRKGGMPLLAFGIFVSGLVGPVVHQADAQNPSTLSMESAVKTSIPITQGDQDKISSSQAVQIALNANPNTTIKSVVVGEENGKSIYEVELSNKSEVKIDAVSGTILREDHDDEGDDGSDEQSEREEKASGKEKVEK